MLFSLIIMGFLFVVVATYLGVKVEGPHHTESTSTQVSHRVSSKGMHKLNFVRSLHTVERSLVNP